MSCSETRRLIDAYLDSELDLRGALELEAHIARCPGCGAEEHGLRELQASVRANLIRYALPPQLEARLHEALGAEEPAASAVSEETRPVAAMAVRPMRRPWKWAALAPAAAAALLVVAAVLSVAFAIASLRQWARAVREPAPRLPRAPLAFA